MKWISIIGLLAVVGWVMPSAYVRADELMEPVVLSGPDMSHGAVKDGHAVRAIAFSPDGRTIVSAANDPRTLCFWNAATCKLELCINLPGDSVRGVAFTADGNHLVVVGDEVTTVDAHSHAIISNWHNNRTPAGIALSPDGKIVALSGHVPDTFVHKGLIELYDASTGDLLRSIEVHTNTVRFIAFSPDGKLLASMAEIVEIDLSQPDLDILVSDVSSGQLVQTLSRPEPARRREGLAFVPAGDKPPAFKNVAISPVGQSSLFVLDGALPGLLAASVGRAIVDGDCGPALRDLRSGQLLFTLLSPFGELPSCAAISPDGQTFAAGTQSGRLTVWTTDRARALAEGRLPRLKCEMLMTRTQFLTDEPMNWRFRLTNVSDQPVPIYADQDMPGRSAVTLHLTSFGVARPAVHSPHGEGLAAARPLAPGASIEIQFHSVGPNAIAAGGYDVIPLPPAEASRDMAYIEYSPPPEAGTEAGGHIVSQPISIVRNPGPLFSHPVYSDRMHSKDGAISVRIHTESALYASNGDVFVKVEIRNDSGHDLTISAPQDDLYAHLHIAASDGPLPPPQTAGRQPRLIPLEAKSSILVTGSLSPDRYPDFFEPGNYTIGYTFSSRAGIPDPPEDLWTGAIQVPPIKIWRVLGLPDAPPATTRPAADISEKNQPASDK